MNNGFNGVGLSQLLKEADVLKGSFHHYFKSKEQFGEALIQHYFETYISRVETILVRGEGNHYQRIISYFTRWSADWNGTCNAHKCLVVKLSAGSFWSSDPMRQALLKGAEKVTSRYNTVLLVVLKMAPLRLKTAKKPLKIYILCGCHASLLSKLNQSSSSLGISFKPNPTDFKR